jgi:hypothetical protein
MRWAAHVARMRETVQDIRGKQKKYDFEHPRINGRITLKWIRIKYCRRAQTGSVSLRIGIQVGGSGQYDSEASGCEKSVG